MTDQFAYWRSALAGKPVDIHADNPQPGYYKARKGKGGPWQPVAIWHKDGQLIARIGGETADPSAIWTWCASNPVSKEDAKHAFEHGTFPGEIGHNSGDMSLAEEITDAAKQAAEWLAKSKIADKVAADTAANMRARLLDLGKKADKERDERKRPHLEAGRKIDAEYKPLVEQATTAANTLRDALTVWMRAEEAKARAAAEAARKAEQERIAKEQAERAAKMAADPIAALTEPEPEPELRMSIQEPPKVQAGGQAGRKAGLRTVVRYEVEDYAAALAHVANHKDVIAAVEKACTAMAKAGATVPGVKRIEEKVAS